MVPKYLEKVEEQLSSGNATEHSYRGALQELVSSIIDDENMTVVNEPKHIKCGAPDYVISKKVKGSKDIPLGYIEAKDIGKDLKSKNYKKQFNNYKDSLGNLIITDYLKFDFYKNQKKTKAEFYETCTIAELVDGKIQPREEEFDRFADLIRDFVTYVGQTIKSPANLAAMMAGKAKMLAEVIRRAIESDEENLANSSLKDQMQAFKKILIHDISPAAFADVYAQTITYGMFAARLHDKTLGDFSRQEAATLIPKTNPFLRNLFQYVSGYDVDDRIVWIVDSLADIFVYTDVNELLKNFGKATKTHDPIIHFYETFLAEYDPKLRKARGVWYTPEPVVNFIVRAVDDILKTEFGLPYGLADTSKTTIKVPVQGKKTLVKKEVHKVQILDPATGTGTFLAEVIKQIHRKFTGMEGIWSDYVEKDLIPRLNGFEILMASYAMAHLKLELLLKETGYQPINPDRFHVYLTNSLEEAHPDTGTLFASWLSNEATAANQVKTEAPVMVVMGNPPYSVSSSNASKDKNGKNTWIGELIGDYKKGLKEKKINLDDDYIKFIRYAQHLIQKNGSGIFAYISNNSFVDGITHRQMRRTLLEAFDCIYILDLHGNSKKKELAPNGEKDQNVFDIMQGVSIGIFIKKSNGSSARIADVNHFDLFGKRNAKYSFLKDNKLKTIDWEKLKCKSPEFYFFPLNEKLQKEYKKGMHIKELFKMSYTGFETQRDAASIFYSENDLKKTVELFMNNDEDSIRKELILGKDGRDWKVSTAKMDLANGFTTKLIQFKPFDYRFMPYTGRSKGIVAYPRHEIATQLFEDNLAFLSPRFFKEDPSYFMSNKFTAHKVLSAYDKNFVFPLYWYQTSQLDEVNRKPNLNLNIVAQIEDGIGISFTGEKQTDPSVFAPIDILGYIYAVLHSPAYREKYKEFLKIDFPRVPYPSDKKKFWELVALGGELRELHLMESAKLNDSIATYPKSGSNEITRKLNKNDWILYDDKNDVGRIWTNDIQYFDKIPLVAWEFYIGGYQPAQKWLKDRRGRTLNMDDIRHYLKIIVALVETDRLMKEIDKVGVV